jgi:hypothetical protein
VQRIRSLKLVSGLSLIVSGVVIGALLATGISWASIPDSSGVIHGCYRASTKAATLKLINNSVTANCPTGDTSITWNQQGVQGPSGATGPEGPSSDQYDSEHAFSELLADWTSVPDCTQCFQESVSIPAAQRLTITGISGEVPGGNVCTMSGLVNGTPVSYQFLEQEPLLSGLHWYVDSPAATLMCETNGNSPRLNISGFLTSTS